MDGAAATQAIEALIGLSKVSSRLAGQKGSSSLSALPFLVSEGRHISVKAGMLGAALPANGEKGFKVESVVALLDKSLGAAPPRCEPIPRPH